MRTQILAFFITCGILGSGGVALADDCCSQGNAKPWAGYNKGIHWSVGLSKEASRWDALAKKGLDIPRGSSLAERQALLSTGARRGINPNWKRGLQPALDLARREGKFVLFFQLVGDLDLEGC